VELEAEKHKVLIDAEVVDLVPMEIEDVDEGLEPLLLVGHSFRVTSAYLSQQSGYLHADFMLILRLIRVPESYIG
jgi:hypothetical protein